MNLRIEKLPTGVVRLTVEHDPKKPPLVVEGATLDMLVQLVETAKRADKFCVQVQT